MSLHMCVIIYMYVYIYIYRERERDYKCLIGPADCNHCNCNHCFQTVRGPAAHAREPLGPRRTRAAARR